MTRNRPTHTRARSPIRLRRALLPALTALATATALLAVQLAVAAGRDVRPHFALDLTLGTPVAADGETLTAVVRLTMADTEPGEQVTVAGRLTGGLRTVGADPSRGGFDAPSGVWTVPTAPGRSEAVLVWRIQAAAKAGDAVERVRVSVTSPRTRARGAAPSGSPSPSGKPVTPTTSSAASTEPPKAALPSPSSTTPSASPTPTPPPPPPTPEPPPPPAPTSEVDVPPGQRCPDDAASACAELRFGKPRLTLARAVDTTDARPGQTVTHTVTVADSGDAAALVASVRNSLPAGAPLLWGALSQGTYDVGTGVWHTGRIAAGGRATLTLAVRVPDPAAGTVMAARSDFVASSDPAPAVTGPCPDDPDSACTSTRISAR